jgi:2-polyprenyl-3-methyl-5-hydroxy-6-metoxy-1,4-benzoquinol methylase
MAAFYQLDYGDNSIATDVPEAAVLAALRKNGAAGTPFDRAWQLRVFRQLGMQAGARVLDFGTSWGYFTLQLRSAGFDAYGFELSKPRAAVGATLGVTIFSDEADIPYGLDVVCSTHVIEHVPQPIKKLQQMLSWVKPGGVVVGFTPNSGQAARLRSPAAFHASWGLVHPVLLSAEAIAKAFPTQAILLTSDDSEANLASWDGRSRRIEACDGLGLLFAIRRDE